MEFNIPSEVIQWCFKYLIVRYNHHKCMFSARLTLCTASVRLCTTACTECTTAMISKLCNNKAFEIIHRMWGCLLQYNSKYVPKYNGIVKNTVKISGIY